MKRTLLLFVLFSQACLGQVTNHPNTSAKDSVAKKHFFISINYGINLPTDNYGTATNTIASNQIQGYAKTGTHANVAGGVRVSGNISLLIKTGLDMNNSDNPVTNTQYSGGFKIWHVLCGVSYEVAPSQYTLLRVYALAGYMVANYPETTINVMGITETDAFKNSNSLGYSMGIGFERKFNTTWGLAANLAYSASYLTYPYYNVSINGTIVSQSSAISMLYGSAEITVGLVLHL